MSNHQSSPSLGKRIGEFLILAIYLAIDVTEIWHRSHFWTLVGAFLGLVALLLLDGGFSRRATLSIAMAAAVICAVIYVAIPEEEVPEVEVVGTLQPGAQPEPPNDCQRPQDPDAAWKILIGNSALQFDEAEEVPLLTVGTCRVVSVKRDSDGLSVIADLFDASGRLIAAIKKNEFHAISGSNARVERDSDLSKLIVKDGAGKEVLYVDYLNKTTVRVRGVFGCPGHAAVRVEDNRPLPGINMNGHCFTFLKGTHITGSVFLAR